MVLFHFIRFLRILVAKLQQILNKTTKFGFYLRFFLEIDLNATNFKELANISFIYVYLQFEIFLNI